MTYYVSSGMLNPTLIIDITDVYKVVKVVVASRHVVTVFVDVECIAAVLEL